LSKPTLSDIRDNTHRCGCGYDNGLRDGALAALCEYVEDMETELREQIAVLTSKQPFEESD
jgi:hypothetical protein